MARAKIGRVRMKAGGADIRLIRQQTPDEYGANAAGGFAAYARRVTDSVTECGGVTGFLGVAFYEDGSTRTHFWWGDKAPCNRAILPLYVAEVIRRDAITETEARAVFDEMFEHV